MRLSLVSVCAVALLMFNFSRAEEHGEKPTAEHGAAAEHGDHGGDSGGLSQHTARTSSRDVLVPRALVAKVEKEYDAFLTKAGVITKTPVKRGLLNIRVDLRQKRGGALHENARVVTPLGGGVVDLSDLVTPVRGAFTALIQSQQEDGHDPANVRVFYVSRAKRRTIAGETYGSGCNTWMEVTSQFNKAMGRDGFQLYTADQRYLSVIAGTFVVVSFAKEALSVASITFTDSRYPQVLCEQEIR